MKAFTNSKSQTGRSKTSCGYCRQQGHSIRECPHIEYDFLEWQAHRVPHKSPTLQHNRWLINDYSYWVKQVNKHYPRWKKAQESISSTGKRVTATRKCGFCRGEGHTRKDCPEMKKVYDDLLRANRNYRQAIYDKLVSQLGLGVGAVVKVQQQQGYYRNREIVESIGTIIDFNLETINLFRQVSGYSLDYDYMGEYEITVMIGDETKSLSIADIEITPPNPSRGSHNIVNRESRWNSVQLVSTIAPSKQVLSEDWIDNQASAFEWLLKKRTSEWLDERGCTPIIDRWK